MKKMIFTLLFMAFSLSLSAQTFEYTKTMLKNDIETKVLPNAVKDGNVWATVVIKNADPGRIDIAEAKAKMRLRSEFVEQFIRAFTNKKREELKKNSATTNSSYSLSGFSISYADAGFKNEKEEVDGKKVKVTNYYKTGYISKEDFLRALPSDDNTILATITIQ